MAPADTLSTTLAAVADPTRRAILARLRDGEASVTELAAPFSMSLPAISKHLKVLERAGLLTRGREAQWRPCALRPEGLRAVADWIEDYRALWEARLDRMAAYLEELQRPAPVAKAARTGKTGKRPRPTPARSDLTNAIPAMTPTDDVPADRLIVTTRILEAPRELVWKVWTDPQHLGHWWGPAGFSTTTDAIDVRVGGQWRFTMHGPDGTDYKNLITFLEVNAPSRLVYEHGGEVDLEPVNFQTTVTFEAMPGEPHRTRLTMRAVFPSAKAREFVTREYNAVEGGKQHLARLAERVEALAGKGGIGGSKPFTLQRVVKAPRELVWKVWTQREHLAQWFGPKGCKLSVPPFELRPGAVMLYTMDWQGRSAMHAKWVFREVQPPQRLEFVVSFTDAQGNTSHHPMAPTWPLEMLTVVTFDEHAGKTHGTVITLQSGAWRCNTEEQRTFDDGHESMRGGWGGTFDVLESYLAKLG